MELSQTALSVLLLCGFPLGVLINITYRLTDLGLQKNRVLHHILINIKDFIFLILAAIITVLLIYYVNDGVYRYHSILGILAGYVMSDFTMGKLVTRLRNTVIGAVYHVLAVPLFWIWSKTLGVLIAKTEGRILIRKTDANINMMMQLASNGFENYTEAKAWKSMKNNKTPQQRAQNRV